MKIILAGGGSGGHVTPLKAIYEALKEQGEHQKHELTIITDAKFYKQTQEIFAGDSVAIRKVFSGKYRRYTSKSLLWHIVHLPTFLKNIRDIFLLFLGSVQALLMFLMRKPDVVFCKGGYVCVPIGLAARARKIPLIIHDSDTRPGLTNRILAKWANTIATGMPTEFYPYPKKRMVYTGIPVKAAFQPVTDEEARIQKRSLGLPEDRPLLLVTGGGNGAVNLNAQVAAIAERLLMTGWSIAQLGGKGKTGQLIKKRETLQEDIKDYWLIDEFAEMVPRLLGADLIIARTSASTIQECANAQKTVIGIPSPHLEDQKMNAEFYGSKQAMHTLDETQLSGSGDELLEAIEALAHDTKRARQLAKNLHASFAKPDAARRLAALIVASS